MSKIWLGITHLEAPSYIEILKVFFEVFYCIHANPYNYIHLKSFLVDIYVQACEIIFVLDKYNDT